MTIKEEAERLYGSVNTFILTCVGRDGYPLTKAVVPGRERRSLEEMYFCTNTSSRFAGEIAAGDGRASVYFFKRGLLWKGCLLKGKMEIVEDTALKQRYWQNKFKNAYAEKSFTDPDFCLLKFTALSGRYYARYTPRDFEIGRGAGESARD